MLASQLAHLGAHRGWIGRDDLWHGEWTTVRTEVRCDGHSCNFTFDPVDLWEMNGRGATEQLIEAEYYLARFRRTLKVRVIAEGDDAPVVVGLHVYGQDLWQELMVDVHSGIVNAVPVRWNSEVEIVNGVALDVTEMPDGLRLRLLVTEGDLGHCERPSPIPADRTITNKRSASVRYRGSDPALRSVLGVNQ